MQRNEIKKFFISFRDSKISHLIGDFSLDWDSFLKENI